MPAFPAVTVSADFNDEQLDSRTPAVLAEMASAYWLPRCLHTVAELGVADNIATAPVTAGVLAQSCGVNEVALYRVMRALSSHNIFELTVDGFAHTALSLPLRSDHPQFVRAFARMIGMPVLWNSLHYLGKRVKLPSCPGTSPPRSNQSRRSRLKPNRCPPK